MKFKLPVILTVIALLFAAYFHLNSAHAGKAEVEADRALNQCRWLLTSRDFTMNGIVALENRYGREEVKHIRMYVNALSKIERIDKALEKCDGLSN